MADVFTKTKRSQVMALIRGHANRSTEMRLIALMRAAGITGWRRGQSLPGRPDFVFRADRVALFVDGCFWHGCPKCYRRPDSNRKYWDAKVLRNRSRDREVKIALRKRGWRVLRIWEHDLKNPKRCLGRISKAIQTPASQYSPRNRRTAEARAKCLTLPCGAAR
jgi:DNA mismatch endonuclease (patch repair protein)